MSCVVLFLGSFPVLDAVVVQLFSGGYGFLIERVFQVVDGMEGVLKGEDGWLIVALELRWDWSETSIGIDLSKAIADFGRFPLQCRRSEDSAVRLSPNLFDSIELQAERIADLRDRSLSE